MPSNNLILCCPLLLLSILPSIRVFLRSQFFASGGQSIGASASASVLPMNIQGWFPLGLTGLLFLQFKGLSSVLSNITVQKPSILWHSAFFMVQLLHLYMATGVTYSYIYPESLQFQTHSRWPRNGGWTKWGHLPTVPPSCPIMLPYFPFASIIFFLPFLPSSPSHLLSLIFFLSFSFSFFFFSPLSFFFHHLCFCPVISLSFSQFVWESYVTSSEFWLNILPLKN